MKKIVSSFFVMLSLLHGDDWNKVCTLEQYQWLLNGMNNNRIISLNATSMNGSEFFGDTKGVILDKKAKTLQIWEIVAISKNDAEKDVQKYGKKYLGEGYEKFLVLYDFQKSRSKTLSSLTYDCSGNTISSFSQEGTWSYIVPDSVGEAKFETLKKHYGF